MQTLQSILVIGLIVFLIFSLFTFLWQRKLIYFPDTRRPPAELAASAGLKEVTLNTEDKLELLAWYKAPTENHPTIVYFHGNAGNIAYRLPLAKEFLARGYGLLLVEYRGYGGNPGSPSEKGFYLDAESAFHFLKQEKIPPAEIVLYGESLGSGVAIEMATRYKVCAVVLQSPYTSLYALAHWHYPWVFIKPWDRFESIKKIDQLQSALLIVHGQKDSIVPYDQAQSLYKNAPEPKKMLSYERLGHLDLWHSAYYKDLFVFLYQHCSENNLQTDS